MRVHSLISLTFSSIVFIISAYLINIFLGRYLGPKDYGIYGIVISLMSVINLIQVSGLPQAVSKYISEKEEIKNEVLKSGFLLQSISTLIITVGYFLLAQPISIMLKDEALTPYIQLSALIFPLYGYFALYTGYYNGLHQFKRQALINIAYSIAKAVFVVFLSLFFYTKGAIIGFIVAPLFSLLVGIDLPNLKAKSFPYRRLILFSVPLIGFAFLSTLQQSVDLYFIKGLLNSSEAAGYYTANQNIARIPFFALSSFSLVLFPSISRNVSKKLHAESKIIISFALRVILFLLIPSTLLLSATSTQLIEIIYSTDYLPAAPSLSILVFGMGFFTIFMLLANIISGAGNPKLSMVISLLGLVVVSFLCLFMVPILGLSGAALATTLGAILSTTIAGFYVFKRFRVLISLKSLVRILVGSIIIYFIARFIHLPNFFLPIFYAVLAGVYLAILVLTKEITGDDWIRVKALIPIRFPF